MTPSVTILLVDEEPLLRRATALMLADRGGEVSAVASIEEAVALAQRRSFDVAVIDVASGGTSPTAFVEHLLLRGQLPRRVVVCSSAPLGGHDAAPFAAVLGKPYVFEHLLTVIFGALCRRRPPRSGLIPRTGRLRGRPRGDSTFSATLRGARHAARARRDRG